MGSEQTFLQDISIKSAVLIELYHSVLELCERINKDDFEGKTLTLKIKYGDFQQITRSITGRKILKTKDDILPLAKKLLKQITYSAEHPIRLMGLSVSNPGTDDELSAPEWIQLELEFKDWDE